MDETFLRRSIALALANVEQGEGGPFGAVIVHHGKIIGEGVNRVVAFNDPSAHAEILAIRAACQTLGSFHLAECTLYASSEPCPMCLATAYWARLQRIVFANLREQATGIGFCDGDLYAEFKRPHQQRRIPTLHLPLPEAEVPLQRWREMPGRIDY